MKLIEDLGLIFPTNNSKQKRHYGIFECPICKEPVRTAVRHVKTGASTKCKSCSITLIKTTHGQRDTRLYNIWKDIVRRCSENPKRKTHKEYFLKGITICNEWKEDFVNFYEWSINNGYENTLTIDRENNNGNYEPENCRWVTKNIQARNTRKLMSTNKSGYRGVSYSSKRKLYIAQITVNKKVIYLGSFARKLDGAKAYDNYVLLNSLEHTINGVTQ